jgi:predicted metal-binding protein
MSEPSALLTIGPTRSSNGSIGGVVRHEFHHEAAAVHYAQALVAATELDRFRVTEGTRLALCEPCPVYLRCWACPGQNDGFASYAGRPYLYCLLYLFWIEVDAVEAIDAPFEAVLGAYAKIASFATQFGRMMEARLGGKEMIDGRCAVCRTCTAAESPPRPCAYPSDQRSSLEALGINVGRLAHAVFGHELRWYRRGRSVPPYVTVVHGLITDVVPPPGVPEVEGISERATEWLDRWRDLRTVSDDIGPR